MNRLRFLIFVSILAGVSQGLVSSLARADVCLTFLNELKPDKAALRPAVMRVRNVIELFEEAAANGAGPEFGEKELNAVKRVFPLEMLQKPKFPELVATQDEILSALEAAEQFQVLTREFQNEVPELESFVEDLHIILFFRFRDLRTVDAQGFLALKEGHQLRYLEYLKRETFSDLKIDQLDRLDLNAQIAAALENEESFWRATILKEGFKLRGHAKSLVTSVYRVNDDILAFRLAIVGKAKDANGKIGLIHIVRYYDANMELIADQSIPEFKLDKPTPSVEP